jgi:hypothetical protein
MMAMAQGDAFRYAEYWDAERLGQYLIKVKEEQNFEDFFESPRPSESKVAEIVEGLPDYFYLEEVDWSAMQPRMRSLLKDIRRASQSLPGSKMAVCQVALSLLQVFEYDCGANLIGLQHPLRGKVAGTEVEVTADVCMETAQDLVVLLVKAVSGSESASITDVLERRPTAEAQLIGLAVAAFQMNAEVMSLSYKVSTFQSQRIPVILMQGTLPTFYIVPVTQKLAMAVAEGGTPASTTVVQKFVLSLNNLPAHPSWALRSRRSLSEAVSCWEALKSSTTSRSRNLPRRGAGGRSCAQSPCQG